MIAYFVRHPTAANLLMLALMLLGLSALPKLQRDTFPLTPPSEVEIRFAYPGASPAEVEQRLCPRIEEALERVTYLREQRCMAREGLALATAVIEEGRPIEPFQAEIQRQVDAITGLPELVEQPRVEILERIASVAGIMITGPMSVEDLADYARKVKARLQADRRIARVDLRGFSAQQILIETRREVLQRYGMGLAELRAAIERQSLDHPAGSFIGSEGEISLRLTQERRTPQEFRDLVVRADAAGGLVRLGEIARISRVFEHPEEQILFNGKRAALLEISKNHTQDSLRVRDAIGELLKREQAMAARGVELTISQDVTSNIRDRLRILIDNGLQGLLLVFLTLWLFFNLRYSFWVAMGLPVSFLGALFFMQLFGYSLNMMTLVALLVAIGLLMDDAIVIAENVAARMQRSGDALQGALEGSRQVLPGVLSSFLTTLMIVGPLAFLAGKMGAVLKYIPAVLLIALAVSLIEAFLILPAHLRHAGLGARRSAPHRGFDRAFCGLRDGLFIPLLQRALVQPFLTLGLILALALASYAMIPAGQLKYQALPVLESDVIQARLLLPQGSDFARTQDLMQRIETGLDAVRKAFPQADDEPLVRQVSLLYASNPDVSESGAHLATLSADLRPAAERSGEVPAMLAVWREAVGPLPDALALRFTDKERGVAGKAIDIRVMGGQLAQIEAAATELRDWLAGFDGVLDVSSDLHPGKPEYRVVLRDQAASLGLDARSLASELRGAVHGTTALEVILAGEPHDVLVRLHADDLHGIEDLQQLPVRSSSGELVPLSAVARILPTQGYARLHRVNGLRTLTLSGSIDSTRINARELMGLTKRELLPRLNQRYPGVRFGFVGQGKESAETGGSLITNLVIGLIGIFIVLSLQFRSYLQPLAVLLALPSGLVGVVWGHLALGLELSMPSLVGLATLLGVVVNDSILLVGFTQTYYAATGNMLDAALEAARDRFRAVLLTSLTTIAGLLPLLLEQSTQAQLLIPLVASLAFGLLSATLLSLFFIPACFLALAELGWYRDRAQE
ncbi:MAG: efflux RND transporter permease subunit [Gammaproteobacteria bacterium SHHR-1]|uniref:efflux RND transporter permease subunit n=1 Tax=Magnetovirga frankeli TaxID=947516 RepID=UPI001292F37A|nr:efflux RND transporter permease subunit [gamma proteobacterium SS-5]